MKNTLTHLVSLPALFPPPIGLGGLSEGKDEGGTGRDGEGRGGEPLSQANDRAGIQGPPCKSREPGTVDWQHGFRL